MWQSQVEVAEINQIAFSLWEVRNIYLVFQASQELRGLM